MPSTVLPQILAATTTALQAATSSALQAASPSFEPPAASTSGVPSPPSVTPDLQRTGTRLYALKLEDPIVPEEWPVGGSRAFGGYVRVPGRRGWQRSYDERVGWV
ncbi:hypothetical protein B0A54_00120 [Friedmanniomyces endolithicus]|uniref:Uncharacterized protein n=1 Tax=Friedmanniomyces endolithicus TaxID=329885 RepID=A0A4U0VJR6_9PEZI|nr:hypothetical protein B0A54_00120 [Friedmanniomyces endolithicus]